MYGVSPQSSLVVVPPKKTWEPFVEIKKRHTNPRIKRPAYPHITMVQPFVEPCAFEEVARILTKALAGIDPFVCTLADFKMFDNGASQTLFIDPVCDPPGSLENVYSVLEATIAIAGVCGGVTVQSMPGKSPRSNGTSTQSPR